MSETIDARVAVLEQIARDTAAALAEIRAELKAIRGEHREDFRLLLNRQDRQFLWLLSVMLGTWATLLGVMAHGFHWI